MRRMFMAGLIVGSCSLSDMPLSAAQDSLLTINGNVDVMYSWSGNQPKNHQRLFQTQPSRNDEVIVNHALLSLRYATDAYRVRVALQAGTFVEANYVGADAAWKNVHELTAGARIADGLWIDAGIMPSHIGYESMIARDNINVSRSLIADYTPYYEAAVKLTWSPSSMIDASILLLNGWQQIVDVNDDKAFGSQVVIRPTSALTMNWSTYVGNEPTPTGTGLRFHNDVWIQVQALDDLLLALLADACLQSRPADTTGTADSTYGMWYLALQSRYSVSDAVRIGARVEWFDDPNTILIAPANATSFRTGGASLNVDVLPSAPVLLRGEVRWLGADNDVFPSSNGFRSSDVFVTASMSVAF